MISSEKESSTRFALITVVVDVLITFWALMAAQSSVLLADFLKTLLEFVAIFLAWIAIRRITRGSKVQFEYGLGKIENLSSLLIGAMMVAVVLVIAGNAIISILNPRPIQGIGVWISIGSQIIYGGINLYLYLRNRAMLLKDKSPIMESQARLFFTKGVGNIFILLSLSLSMLLREYSWSMYIDPAASLFIAVTIFISAMGVFSNSFYDLLDRTLEEADQMKLMRVLATQFDQYDDMYGIRSRRAGGKEFIEVFLGYEEDTRVGEVQQSMDNVRHAIKEQFPDASVMIVLSNTDVSTWDS
jgi:cation diffusion facilitator family transporter